MHSSNAGNGRGDCSSGSQRGRSGRGLESGCVWHGSRCRRAWFLDGGGDRRGDGHNGGIAGGRIESGRCDGGVAESAATASAAGAGASPAPPRSPAEESTIIGSLVAEQVQQGDETTCGERPTQAELDLAAEIGPVVAGYNRSIVEEKLSRRERFRTERLVDARQRATGQTVDEQLDFLCEEDNCAVVFEDESGKLFWVLGHIEYMATTRSDVSLNRIAPRDLERLEKDHQVRVSIDDSRSIFLFKWYIEVDKDGKDLPGYQNKV